MAKKHKLRILWYLKPNDGRHTWRGNVPGGKYRIDHHRLQRLGNTLDRAGFYGALVTGDNKHDPWTQIASLIPVTKRMRFMPPIHPGVVPPTVLATRALTLDHYSGGRIMFNQVNGGDMHLHWWGVPFKHDERYDVSEEYWTLFKRIYRGEEEGPYEGKYFKFGRLPKSRIIDLPRGPVQLPHTPIWGSGASEPGIRHAGRILDTYLTFLQHPDRLKKQVDAAHASAAANGRELRIGTYCHVIVRETEKEAWDHVQGLLADIGVDGLKKWLRIGEKRRNDGVVQTWDTLLASEPDPHSQVRIKALRDGRLPTREELEISPNIWVGPNGNGPFGRYIVGNPEQVAARVNELHEKVGIDTFIFATWPLIDEAERVGELLLPRLEIEHPAPVLAQHDYYKYPSFN